MISNLVLKPTQSQPKRKQDAASQKRRKSVERGQPKLHKHYRSIRRHWYYYHSRPKPLHTTGDTASRCQDIPSPGGFHAARAAAVTVAIRRQGVLYQSILCSWRRLVPLSPAPWGCLGLGRRGELATGFTAAGPSSSQSHERGDLALDCPALTGLGVNRRRGVPQPSPSSSWI